MLKTAIKHFNEDIDRAKDLLRASQNLTAGRLQDDVMRASWMMAVGACDAYFCDAYADLVSRTLRAKELQPKITIPDRLANLKVPVVAVISGNAGWRWRMAARSLIQDETVLSVEKVRTLFNQFLREKEKMRSKKSMEFWILHPDAKKRCFAVTATEYRSLSKNEQDKKRKVAAQHFETRMKTIFQRRHDCIHDCDRPKVAPQSISKGMTEKAIQDVSFFVCRMHEALVAEFPEYLRRMGCSAPTRNQVLQ